MPTIFTHAFVAMAGAKVAPVKNITTKFWILSVICAVIPDADVIAYYVGIPWQDFFGHRGFFHSPLFALMLSPVVVLLFFREERAFSRRWFGLVLYFFLITTSHGVLDAFTSGGLGVALWLPFSSARFSFPFTPIDLAPITIRQFFSEWGARVVVSELIWVWFPLTVLLAVLLKLRKAPAKKP